MDFFFISSRSSIVIVITPTMLSNRCTFRFMNKDYGCCRCYKAMPHSSNLYLQFMNQHHYFSFDNKIWCKLFCNKDLAKLTGFTWKHILHSFFWNFTYLHTIQGIISGCLCVGLGLCMTLSSSINIMIHSSPACSRKKIDVHIYKWTQ